MKTSHIILVTVIFILLVGCGGGSGGSGGSDSQSSLSSSISSLNSSSAVSSSSSVAASSVTSNSSSSRSSESADIINIDDTSNIDDLGNNLLDVTIKSLKIERITVDEIGDIKEHYKLQQKKSSVSDLNEIGSKSADLSNKEDPLDVKSGMFYHIKTNFTTQGTYPEGVNFIFSLVSTDENNSFTQSVCNQNIILDTEGEHEISCNILVPTSIASGKYLLVAGPSSININPLMTEMTPITSIDEIGAIYVEIQQNSFSENSVVLDINTTKYIDIPYRLKKAPLFENMFLQHASGKGEFLFSNIDTKDINVSIQAKLTLSNGDEVTLGLLDTNTHTLKSSVIITLPHSSEDHINKLLASKFQIDTAAINVKKAQNTQVTDITPDATSALQEMNIHQAFIPYAGNGAKGEQRYRTTLSYYIPEDSYDNIITIAPDLSLSQNSSAVNGEIKWNVIFINEQTAKELTDSINLTKFRDITTVPNSIIDNISIIPPHVDFGTPVDAALDMPDGTAYVFNDDKCAPIDTKTGVVGSWVDTWSIFTGGSSIVFNQIEAAFRSGDIAYFFTGNEKYFTYSLTEQKLLYTDSTSNFDIKGTEFTPNPMISKLSECMKTYFDGYMIDAAFNDYDGNIYFISDKKYMIINRMQDSDYGTYYDCYGGDVADKEEWSSASKSYIAAVLSDNKGNGKFRFFNADGFANKIVLNKPNLFIDKFNNTQQEVGDSDIVSLKFDAEYGLQSRWFVPQARAYTSSHLNFYIFSKPFALFALEADVYGGIYKIHPYLDPGIEVKTKRGAHIFVSVLGDTAINEGSIYELTVTAQLDLNNTKRSIVEHKANTLADNQIYDWEEKSTLFHARFPVGPIMLGILGGIEGNVSIASPIEFEEQDIGAELSIKPMLSAGVGVFIDGEVNYELVKAGVEIDLALAQTGVIGNLSGILKLEDDKLKFSVETEVDPYIRFIQSNFFFYAGTRTRIKWCSSWGVPYPCGIGWDTWDIPIYSTPWLYNKEMVLFQEKLLDEYIPLD